MQGLPNGDVPRVTPVRTGLEQAPPVPATVARVDAVGTATANAPENRFLVGVERDCVRIRALPMMALSASEARGFAAYLLHCADQVATEGDVDFADMYAALIKRGEPRP